MHVSRDTNGGRRTFALRATAVAVTAATMVAMPSALNANGERTIALYNVHTKETLRIVFKRNGKFVPDALKKLNWHLRDWRRNKPTDMDPALIDLVWSVHSELGSKEPVHVISGFRSQVTNQMLRRTRGGQARRSQHILGKAMDVQFPDIPVRRLRYSALLRQQGGVGYYPTSTTPFVHIDTGRVRHWPRMSRQELALLFPSGRTKHRPSGGGPITRDDAVAARRRNPGLAKRIAAFYADRRRGPMDAATGPRFATASVSGNVSPPRLVTRPRIAWFSAPAVQPPRPAPATSSGLVWRATVRPPATGPTRTAALSRPQPAAVAKPQSDKTAVSRQGARGDPGLDPRPAPFRAAAPEAPTKEISTKDRQGLRRLASASLGLPSIRSKARHQLPPVTEPRLGAIAQPRLDEWIRAPAYDDEHAEELFYRPFPIAPFITQTASADDPALRQLTHPNIDRTLELLSHDGSEDQPMQLRPGFGVASLMWSQAFTGTAHGHQALPPQPTRTARSSGLGRRMVKVE